MQLPSKTFVSAATELLPARFNEVPLGGPSADMSSDWFRDFGLQHPHGYAERAEEWYIQCAYYGLVSLKECVEIDPQRRGGVPVLKGTRVTVSEALGEIAESQSVQEVADNFDLELESLKCLLNSLSLLLNRPYPK